MAGPGQSGKGTERGKPQYRAWLESLSDPSERYELDEIVYTDRQGGLLQVSHDMDELAKTSAAEAVPRSTSK